MKNCNIILFLLLCITFFTSHENAYALSDSDEKKSYAIDSLLTNSQIEIRTSYAFFIHHHFEMTSYPAHFPMFELSFQKQTYGKQYWQAYFNYPTIGFSAFYSNLGNIDIIGKAYALYPFINFPLNKSKTNTFSFRMGVGLGYLTNKYHPTENFHNTSIGSNVNAAISLTFEYKRYLSERYKISVFAGLTHFSNGSSTEPNNGLNIINAGLSATYLLKDAEEYIPKQYSQQDFKKIKPEFYIGLSYGTKRILVFQENYTSVFNLEFYVLDRISNLSKIGFGLDLVYDATDNIYVKNYYGYNFEPTFLQLLKPGISLAYELLMGDASFLFNFGYHPYGLDMSYGRWYQKLALKVDVGKFIFGKITLNTHFGAADFIGFGIGVKL